MRILITGSSGQIGTNLALRCLADGHTVYGVDVRWNPWTDAVDTIIQDLGVVYEVAPGRIGPVTYPAVDLVVHLAAHAKVHALVQRPAGATENYLMTANVLEFARQAGVPVVLASSREVYGQQPPTRGPVPETAADFTRSPSPYAATKLAGEALAASYRRCYGLPFAVIRFSNVYGRYDSDVERLERVLWVFARAIRRGEPVTVYGAEKMLDFTYVDDAVAGLYRCLTLLAAQAPEVVGETFSLAYGEGNRLTTLAELIGQALERAPEIRISPSLPGEVTYYVADLGKARRLLEYQPQTPLDDGVPRALRWAAGWEQAHGPVRSQMFA